MLAISLVLILFAWCYADIDIVEPLQPGETTVIEEKELRQISEDVREYIFEEGKAVGCLVFFTNHQESCVYADGTLIYSVSPVETAFGNTTGSRWNYVDIPYGTKELTVQVTALEIKSRNYNMVFYQGNGVQMLSQMLLESVPEVLVSFVDIALGILLIGYWLAVCRKDKGTKAILYVGIFAACIGCWSFYETEMAALLITNSEAMSFTTYMMLLLAMVPFVLFVREFLEVQSQFWATLFCVAAYIHMVVCVVLHMAGVVSFKRTVTGTHVLMICGILYLVGAMAAHWKRVGFDRKIKANLLGVVVLVVALGMDMVAFYLGLRKTDVLGRIGLLIYICLVSWKAANVTLQRMNEGRKAEIYKELAMKDMLTGLYNRNAYDRWLERHKPSADTVIVTFDLNNLKQCNDTRGHSAGDQYITGAAEIIRKVFDGAEAFRIGGDEFCAILQSVKDEELMGYLKRLRELEEEYNRKNRQVTMKIACGYARFDPGLDKNLEHTRDRADARMYQNKKELKGNG